MKNTIRTLLIGAGIASLSTLALAQQYPQVQPGQSIPPGTTAQLSVADTGQARDPAGLQPVASSQQPVTRTEVKQDLRNLEQVGYQPEEDRVNYPQETQKAEKREWIKNQQMAPNQSQ